MGLQFHALADLFPLLEGAQFDELVGSIVANGLRENIVLYEGKILDGRNRYRACIAAGREPRTEAFTGEDPLKFVVDKNIHRRHLNESQRALIAARLVTTKSGDNQHTTKTTHSHATTLERAAGLLNVSPSLVSLARKVLHEGSEDEVAAIKQGTARVDGVGMKLRAEQRVPAAPRAVRGANRAETLRLRAEVWADLRAAFGHLASLPLPTEAAAIAREKDKGGLIDRRLVKSIKWLEEFTHAWNRDADQGSNDDVQQAAR